MAVATSTGIKGSLLESNYGWHHGELSKVEAEQALKASMCDCFLVRVSEGALILSLIHRGQLHHLNIKKYKSGWYDLESGTAQYSFSKLEELVTHYTCNNLGNLRIKLGAVCEKRIGFSSTAEDNTHFYYQISDSSTISRYGLQDLTKYKWYHENATQKEAERALKSQGSGNMFLVRKSDKSLVLSKRVNGWVTHNLIQCSPNGYQLSQKNRIFESVPELIKHYQDHAFSDLRQVLGTAVTTVPSEDALIYETVFKMDENQLKIQWKRCANSPITVSAPQLAKIGDRVYMEASMNNVRENGLFRFDVKRGTWSSLPPCPTSQHGLTVLNNELIAIGGKVGIQITNIAHTFRDGKWVQDLPPMPTPRCLLSAMSHDNRLIIAAGGIAQVNRTGKTMNSDAVEVYIDESRTWFSTNPLPFPVSAFSMCIVGDICYILGGTAREDQVNITLYITVPSLLENAASASWKQLQDEHPLCLASPVELDGRLVAMGGSSDPIQRCGTRFISKYNFAIDTWEVCKNALLPVPLYRVGVVKLDSNQVMIVGGQPMSQQFSAAVYIGNYSYFIKQ